MVNQFICVKGDSNSPERNPMYTCVGSILSTKATALCIYFILFFHFEDAHMFLTNKIWVPMSFTFKSGKNNANGMINMSKWYWILEMREWNWPNSTMGSNVSHYKYNMAHPNSNLGLRHIKAHTSSNSWLMLKIENNNAYKI